MRYFFIILTIGAIIYNIYVTEWEILFAAVLTLVLILMPTLLARRARISIPSGFQIFILLFVFASMYLGEVHGYFHRFRWWDRLLHSTSAVVLGYIGFVLIYALNKDSRMEVKLSPLFMALFSFCFAVTIGTLWEIFEFGADALVGANMQKARNLELIYGSLDTRLGLLDTMVDLIVNVIGALFVSILGYFHVKYFKDNDTAFWNLHRQFITENPELFGLEDEQPQS